MMGGGGSEGMPQITACAREAPGLRLGDDGGGSVDMPQITPRAREAPGLQSSGHECCPVAVPESTGVGVWRDTRITCGLCHDPLAQDHTSLVPGGCCALGSTGPVRSSGRGS
ncbi:hypothetical protein NDU88_000609 [Pleurodeles waltl]|uniref:Uncharacterized protein n=1 Tax=Pleurodeles waltl TaxID=8319 RepID=A0AAV7V5J6_PLEWA|nr:hypothetical protein NDU88_000609 [Pleurodeles waltl]